MRAGSPLVACVAVLLAAVSAQAADKLYRHVDAKGNVTYTDRPAQAGQKPEKIAPANTASAEARRQMELERRDSLRRQQEERVAAQRRAMADRPPYVPQQPRYGRIDPNLPDSQPPSDTSRRSY